jgi:hypothetical protein
MFLKILLIPPLTLYQLQLAPLNYKRVYNQILQLLGQFLLTKINLSKVSNCCHFLRSINIPTKEKIHSISNCESTMLKI